MLVTDRASKEVLTARGCPRVSLIGSYTAPVDLGEGKNPLKEQSHTHKKRKKKKHMKPTRYDVLTREIALMMNVEEAAKMNVLFAALLLQNLTAMYINNHMSLNRSGKKIAVK